jgi:hypothetical protein
MLEVLHVFISFSKQFHKTYISILKVKITQQRKWGWGWSGFGLCYYFCKKDNIKGRER